MAKKEGSILIIDDNSDLLIALKLVLGRSFSRIETLRNPNLILSTLEKETFDLILLDMNFKAGQVTGNEGIFWMNKIREKDPNATLRREVICPLKKTLGAFIISTGNNSECSHCLLTSLRRINPRTAVVTVSTVLGLLRRVLIAARMISSVVGAVARSPLSGLVFASRFGGLGSRSNIFAIVSAPFTPSDRL